MNGALLGVGAAEKIVEGSDNRLSHLSRGLGYVLGLRARQPGRERCASKQGGSQE